MLRLLLSIAFLAVPVGFVLLLSFCFNRRYLKSAGFLLAAAGFISVWLCDGRSREGPYLAAVSIALGLAGVHVYLMGLGNDIAASVEDAQKDINVRLIALEAKLLERADTEPEKEGEA